MIDQEHASGVADSGNPLTLHGRVAVVTGGARGIGGSTAHVLASRGARVVIADLLAPEGEETVRRITGDGGTACFVRTDITDATAVAALMEQANALHGQLDVLVCCAGILRGAFQEVDVLADETFSQVIDVNVRGTFLAVRAAVPYMRRLGHGVIVMVASGAGVRGPSSSLAYAASKGGVNGFGMTLEAQLGPHGIRVHVVCPGSIATPLKLENIADGARARGRDPEAAVASAQETGQVGDPLGVAKLLAFLASDEAAYVRGPIFTR